MTITNIAPWKRRSEIQNELENPIRALRQEMDALFNNLWHGLDLDAPAIARTGFVPSINISDDEKHFEITAELPGMNQKEVEVTINGDILTIKGEKKFETEDKKKNYYRIERSFGSFQRSIPLPSELQRDKIDASFKDGVLKISMPKTQAAQNASQRVEIKSA